MSDPYLGEIRMVGFNFAPVGWALCNGQLMLISQNDALFSLLGTTYGGDGQQTFGLPDLQSRIPIHQGSGYVLGQFAGTEIVTLSPQEMPAHTHTMQAVTDAATQNDPNNNLLAKTSAFNFYQLGNPNQPMAAAAITPAGGSLPHDNTMPFLVINFIIALVGIFPSQA